MRTPVSPEHHAAVGRHVYERAQEPHPTVPAAARDADADARVVEPHAQPLPAGGHAACGRAAGLGCAVPGAADHDGDAHPRGEPVRDSPGAQGWGGYCKPSGVWIPPGAPPHYPGTPHNTPGSPRPTLPSPDNTPGGSKSLSTGSYPPQGTQTQPRHPQLTPQWTPNSPTGSKPIAGSPGPHQGDHTTPQGPQVHLREFCTLFRQAWRHPRFSWTYPGDFRGIPWRYLTCSREPRHTGLKSIHMDDRKAFKDSKCGQDPRLTPGRCFIFPLFTDWTSSSELLLCDSRILAWRHQALVNGHSSNALV